VRLLTAVWTDGDARLGRPYLRPGAELWRDDVAGLLLDGVLPAGALLEKNGTTWRVLYEGRRGGLVDDKGEILWAVDNGSARLVGTEWFTRGMDFMFPELE